MGIVILLAAAGLGFFMTRKGGKSASPTPLTADQLDAAAKAAERAGDLEEAERLSNAADIQRAIGEHDEGREAESLIRAGSPIPDATPAQYWEFFRRSRRWPLSDLVRGPKEDQVGAFHFGMRTLGDLGLVTIHKQGDRYEGAWKVQGFLTSPRLQYEAWMKLGRNHRAAIMARHKSRIGSAIVNGAPLTLSGMMGVSQTMGLASLAKWLDDPKPETTALAERFNGVF